MVSEQMKVYDLREPTGIHCPGCGWSSGGHGPGCPVAPYVAARVADAEREWENWSNELATLIHDGDESTYSNPEGSQESIILDVFRVYSERFIRDAEGDES